MDSIKILYEDSQITVCVKPAGILSQTGKTGEASMVTQLETQLGTSIYPVHRLDREAAGVMVYAKTERGAADLSRQIQSGKLEKEYLAVVQGRPRPDQGMLTDFLYHDQRKNKTYVVKRPRKGVKEARLLYRVLMGRWCRSGCLPAGRTRFGYSLPAADGRWLEMVVTAAAAVRCSFGPCVLVF